MRFNVVKKTIEVFEREEITKLLSPSNREVVRLFVLLGLNCGMTQIDISDLRHDEIDWQTGRLSRKRSKTSDQANTPKVEYALWPETFELLTRLRSTDPTRVLVTRSGKPWLETGEKVKDSIGLEFRKLNPTLPFKHLRKTGATMLDNHGEYGAYAQHFLGHSPSSVAASHYVKPSQTRFDAAVSWLREQLLTGVPVA
jgi:integrase